MPEPRFLRHCRWAAALLLVGCAAAPDYRRPDMELPAAWPASHGDATAAAPTERWWSVYADPVLDRLADEALANNADLQVALARVLETRALAGIASADRYPAVSANLNRSRTGSSLEGAFPLPSTVPRIQTTTRATLDVAYELDLWGRYARASDAARAELLAAESARDAVRLSLTAQVAQQYFALLAADAQEEIGRRTQGSRAETLDLFRQRLAAGAISEYDLRQAEAELAATRATLANLVQARERAEAALALLLGRSPREVMAGHVERGAPPALERLLVPAGLPSDLLLRRPDLRAAEHRLMAANARIGAARAQYFPSIGLTAFLGSESVALGSLFSGPAGIFQFSVGLAQPIWNAGRIGYGVEATEARRDAALAEYRRAVANAFKDVREALAAQATSQERLAAETARSEALSLALGQARLRFEAGIASRLDVLDVERNLLQAQLNRVDAERARKAALADLHKALGGGWGDSHQPMTKFKQ